MKDIKNDIESMKKQMQDIRAEQRGFREEIKHLKTENEETKEELCNFKYDMDKIDKVKIQNNVVVTGLEIQTAEPIKLRSSLKNIKR